MTAILVLSIDARTLSLLSHCSGKQLSYFSDEVIENIMMLLEQGIKLMSMNALPGDLPSAEHQAALLTIWSEKRLNIINNVKQWPLFGILAWQASTLW